MGCLGTWQSRQILTCRAFTCAPTHIRAHTHKIHKTLPHEDSKFCPPSKWMSSHCKIHHPFFAQLNLLIQFDCKPVCLSSRSQTVSCPHCSLFFCTVYFSLSFALLSLNYGTISRDLPPGRSRASQSTVPPPPPSFPAVPSSSQPPVLLTFKLS